MANSSTKVSNCYNAGAVSAPKNHAGVIGGAVNNAAANVSNIFNVGEVTDNENAMGRCRRNRVQDWSDQLLCHRNSHQYR